jgi:hypothetical protein
LPLANPAKKRKKVALLEEDEQWFSLSNATFLAILR